MKTKEFIEKVKAMGYKAENEGRVIFVAKNDDCIVLSVPNNHQYVINCNYTNPAKPELFLLAVEYAKTPVEERKEEKKRYVKICDNPFGYLNIDTETNEMDVETKEEDICIKTKFTDKEIEQLKQRDNIPLDWDKVKFEEAD